MNQERCEKGFARRAVRASDYLEASAVRFPDKTAFENDDVSLTFSKLRQLSLKIADQLVKGGVYRKPVAVYMEKSPNQVAAFMGAVYAGCFYSPVDVEMPEERVKKIMEQLHPEAVIATEEAAKKVSCLCPGVKIIVFETACEMTLSEQEVQTVLERASTVIDTDPLYVLFTSGSTGTPKGVIITNRGLIDFTEWAAERFGIDDRFIFGNQTPFYFSMSIMDIYGTLRNGATTYMIPHKYFSFPAVLMKYLNEKQINTLYWVPSALSFVAAFKALSSPFLSRLKRVWFGGEVMPVKRLNEWMEVYKDVQFVNFYGPTEVTDTCTYFVVDRHFEDTDRLPMGVACANKDVFLLDESDRLIQKEDTDTIGEVCVRGSGLAYGYLGDPDKTKSAFVQNPLVSGYEEKIYRTGDLAKYNELGEFVYLSRKDYQIKHMGHRIELGEIEAAVSSVEGLSGYCVLYDKVKSKIVLFYSGQIEERELTEWLKSLLPAYMLPNKKVRMEQMPLNLNGKVDRKELQRQLEAV